MMDDNSVNPPTDTASNDDPVTSESAPITPDAPPEANVVSQDEGEKGNPDATAYPPHPAAPPTVQRVGRKDRKARVNTRGGLFEALPPLPPSTMPEESPASDNAPLTEDAASMGDPFAAGIGNTFAPAENREQRSEISETDIVEIDAAVAEAEFYDLAPVIPDADPTAMRDERTLSASSDDSGHSDEHFGDIEENDTLPLDSAAFDRDTPENEPSNNVLLSDDDVDDSVTEAVTADIVDSLITGDTDPQSAAELEAFLDELDSSLVQTISEDDDKSMSFDDEDDYAQFRPPEDRFPPLPTEPGYAAATAAQPRLKLPPALAPITMESPTSTGYKRGSTARGGTPPPNEPPVSLPPPRGRGGQNIFTLLFLVGGIALVAYFAFLWRNPYSALNPLPPLTPLPIIITATLTATNTPLPSSTPTPTRTPTAIPSATPTPEFSPTPENTEGITADGGTGSVTLENVRFRVDGNRTLYLTNPDGRGGCAWASIAGTVTNAAGEALNDYRARILGSGIDEILITGSSPGFGLGGFEYQIGRDTVEADFTIQLLDSASTPVSEVFAFSTADRCDWNIAVLRFVEVSGDE